MNKLIVVILLFPCFKSEAQTSDLMVADSLFATGNYTKAIAVYKKQANQNAAYSKIAEAYQALGNFDEALKHYKHSIVANPKHINTIYKYANLLYQTKNNKQSLVQFESLIKMDSSNANYHYKYGLVLEKLKDSTAINSYKRAILIDNSHQKSIQKTARHFLIKGMHDSVRHYVSLGLKTYANNADLISLQAQSYYKKQAYQKAVNWFEKLLALNENSVFIYEKLGYSYSKLLEFEKAIKHLEIAIKLEPKNAKNLFALGQLYDRINNYEFAEKYMKQAIELLLIPLDQKYTQLATVLNQQKKCEEAINILLLAISENPKNSQAHFYLLTTKDKYYKDKNEILKAFQEFNKKFPSNVYTPFINKRISELKTELFRKE